jgi:hypothetical protein
MRSADRSSEVVITYPKINPQFSGVQEIESADKRRERVGNRSEWPYNHLFPPPNADPVNEITRAAALPTVPAIGSTVVALAYRVPSGSRFIMTGIIQNAFGGLVMPGDLTWTVDKNAPVGIADFQGMGVQGLINIPIALGSFAFGVIWEFKRPYEFEPLDLIQSKVTNVASGGVGPGNPVLSAFLGYRIPVVGLR